MHKVITSPSNEIIKNIRKLQSKKNRDESQMFYVEGIRHIMQGFEENAKIDKLIICPNIFTSDTKIDILGKSNSRHVDIIEVNENVFRTISSKEGPQGIAAVFHQNWSPITYIEEGIWVGLENVQDPGNLGSILRTLDSVGGKGILTIGDSTDPYHPTSVRASMGAIFTQKIVKASRSEFINWIPNSGSVKIIGTSCTGGADYHQFEYGNSVLLLMGSEQKGLSDELKNYCQEIITIPMVGTVDSLNLSNATSIVLYEIYNRLRS